MTIIVASIVLIALGAILMFIACCKTMKILKLLSEEKSKEGGSWKFLLVLQSLFLVGYLIVCGIIYADLGEALALVVGVVFLGGGGFVLLVTSVNLMTLQDLFSNIVAKRAAETSNQTKGEFLANMSHEIRTPLNAVIGMTEIILMSDIKGEQREHVETISQSGSALLELINDILDYSKLEAGRLPLESAPFDLREVVENLAVQLRPLSKKRGIELLIDYPPTLPFGFRGDGQRIRQIVLNFISNAIKFTDKGHVIVKINCELQDDNLALVYIAVSDTGIGISAKHIERIFEKFTQEDSSTSRRFGGTGLGLAICQQLATIMEGKVGANSKKGHGSTFWFELPLPRADVAPTSRPKAGHYNASSIYAAVVDDNSVNLEIMSGYLGFLGIRFKTFLDPKEALQGILEASVSDDPFTLGVLDQEMPGMDGLTLCRKIKEKASAKNLPIMLISSIGDTLVPTEYKAIGFSVSLQKPVTISQFTTALQEVFRDTMPEGADAESKSGPKKTYQPIPANILVVEDNKVNQLVAKKMLNIFQSKSDFANNGDEGLKMAVSKSYDLILMDCQMPVMNGFDASRELRKHESITKTYTPIIALTANALEGDRQKCLDAGMDDYLKKPVKLDEMHAMLLKWMKK